MFLQYYMYSDIRSRFHYLKITCIYVIRIQEFYTILIIHSIVYSSFLYRSKHADDSAVERRSERSGRSH